MLKIVFLISALVGLSSGQLLPKPGVCGIVPATSSLITYGNKTKIGEYPWTVLFQSTNGTWTNLCGGSLINERYVVTAGHCVEREMGFVSYVRLGEWNRTRDPDCEQNERNETFCAPSAVNVAVENMIVHPQYELIKYTRGNETFLVKLIYDIALLRLAHPVNFTKFVSPICLPVEPELSSATFEGIEMDVVGWGRTEHNNGTSPVKLKATVKVINLGECKKRKSYTFDDSAICAGGVKGVNSCRGDSGGPLVGIHKTNANSSHYFLAGVVSNGPVPCTVESPGIYTRVGRFIDWIKENVKP